MNSFRQITRVGLKQKKSQSPTRLLEDEDIPPENVSDEDGLQLNSINSINYKQSRPLGCIEGFEGELEANITNSQYFTQEIKAGDSRAPDQVLNTSNSWFAESSIKNEDLDNILGDNAFTTNQSCLEMLRSCGAGKAVDCGATSTAMSTKASQKGSISGSSKAGGFSKKPPPSANSSGTSRPEQKRSPGGSKTILKLENITLKSPQNFSLKQHSFRKAQDVGISLPASKPGESPQGTALPSGCNSRGLTSPSNAQTQQKKQGEADLAIVGDEASISLPKIIQQTSATEVSCGGGIKSKSPSAQQHRANGAPPNIEQINKKKILQKEKCSTFSLKKNMFTSGSGGGVATRKSPDPSSSGSAVKLSDFLKSPAAAQLKKKLPKSPGPSQNAPASSKPATKTVTKPLGKPAMKPPRSPRAERGEGIKKVSIPANKKIVKIITRSGERKQRMVEGITAQDAKRLKSSSPPHHNLSTINNNSQPSSGGGQTSSMLGQYSNGGVRLRTGSPGSRNCDGLVQESKNSPNPKQYLEKHFKVDMKKLGIDKDMKVLKQFKFCLMSRSHDTIQQNEQPEETTIDRNNTVTNTSTIQHPQHGTSLDTLYQNNTTLNNQSLALESEKTTLERTDMKMTTIPNAPLPPQQQSSLQESLHNRGPSGVGGVGGAGKSKFIMPYKRRQLLRSQSPPKPQLQICTENYIVYS